MKFVHVTSVQVCTRCTRIRESHGIGLSLPYLGLVLVAAVPFCLRLATSDWGLTWIDALCLVGAELFGLYLSGLLLSAASILVEERPCPCGGPMTSRGRYFTHSSAPRGVDGVLALAFVALNVAAWLTARI